jgi:hypothetical protein
MKRADPARILLHLLEAVMCVSRLILETATGRDRWMVPLRGQREGQTVLSWRIGYLLFHWS